MRLKGTYGFQEVTVLQAMMLLDRFLVLNKDSMETAILPLLAIVCLQISVKLHEKSVIDHA